MILQLCYLGYLAAQNWISRNKREQSAAATMYIITINVSWHISSNLSCISLVRINTEVQHWVYLKMWYQPGEIIIPHYIKAKYLAKVKAKRSCIQLIRLKFCNLTMSDHEWWQKIQQLMTGGSSYISILNELTMQWKDESFVTMFSSVPNRLHPVIPISLKQVFSKFG